MNAHRRTVPARVAAKLERQRSGAAGLHGGPRHPRARATARSAAIAASLRDHG
jgi:hypothetical protein